jgi:hypothetical protein
MPGLPRQPRPLPPVRRDYEGSRLEAQQIISAYECVNPVIRRPLKAQRGSPRIRGTRGGLEGVRKAIGGSHQ